jgi:predicted dehydrogenase
MTTKNSPVSVAIIGAGQRGWGFGYWISELPHLGKIVAVAEPDAPKRERFAKTHALGPDAVFADWQALLQGPKRCDAVVIATLDDKHLAPALAALEKGYHLLLEKPMSNKLEECRQIEAAQRKSGAIVAVCHSMRYHSGFAKVKELLASGTIGRLVTMDQIEQVNYWHQAHSFVRGNWRRLDQSSPMLLAKSCHDLDYISHLVGKACLRVSSAGSLTHFRPEFAPAGSTDYCTGGCAVESTCPYSALKIYVNAENRAEWPASVVSLDHSKEAHLEAIKAGPYGRCVWRCDNDVVDHQVVMMEFEGAVTATFTMTAFTRDGGRQVRLHGTEGELHYDEDQEMITIKRYADKNTEKIALGREIGGHGGGDTRVIRTWLQAIRSNDPGMILTNAQESLKTHTLVFAAEKARLEKRVVDIAEFSKA